MKLEKSLKKIKKFFIRDIITFKIYIPAWLILFIVLLPMIAYADLVIIGKRTFFSYLGISAIEIFLVYLGFMFAIITIKAKGKKG